MRSILWIGLLGCTIALTGAHAGAVEIYAQTGFNDQAGINGNPTGGSPYTIGQSAAGRGVGESGWGDQWVALNGGGLGGDADAIVKTAAAFEGDGGLALTTGSRGSTVARRRLAEARTDRFVIETRVNFGSVGELHGIPLMDNYPLSVDRNGPIWRITGPVGARRFEVFDGQSNQLGDWEDTGIEQLPGEWQNVVMDVNVATQRFTFSVDGVPYNAPDPLGFHNAASHINALAFFNTGSGSIDSVIVRAVPEPATASVLGAMLSAVLVTRRRRSRSR